MQDNGPLIALIFFILISLVAGLMAWQDHDELMGADPETTSMDAEIKVLQDQVATVENELQAARSTVTATQAEIRLQELRYQLNDMYELDYRRAFERRQGLTSEGTKFGESATALQAKMVEAKEKTATNMRQDENQVRERVESQVVEFNKRKDESAVSDTNDRKEFEKFEKDFHGFKNVDLAARSEYKRQLKLLTERDVQRANLSAKVDGKVVLADTLHNTIVINLGTSVGVKNGYRFECFSQRSGNERVHKGWLEVRKATPTMSECLLVRQVTRLPRDPYSEYVAKDPEEKYSPYHQSSKKTGGTAQHLTAQPVTKVSDENAMDPIVVGDLVSNPLLSLGKPFTFYISGDKTITNGIQKSAIAYPWTHIKRVVEGYGGTVVEKVDLGVDFVIAQKNAEEDDDVEFGKAKTLGIPVIFEWELFRFLADR